MTLRQVKTLAAVIFAVIITASATVAQTRQQDELKTAVREATDRLNSKIPKGNKIVILNVQSGSADLSDYIISELIENAINDGFYTVIDRQQLDVIQAEQQFQMSGAVDDKSALEIGKFFGAQTIVSGAVKSIGEGYRLSVRALDVQTAQVQAWFNRDITASKVINSLLGNGSHSTGSTNTTYYDTPTTTGSGRYSTDSRTPAVAPAPARAAPAPAPAPARAAPAPAPAPARAAPAPAPAPAAPAPAKW